jgi:purine-binding chemotaxis protein CheW
MAYEEDSLAGSTDKFEPDSSSEDEVLAELKKIILGSESTPPAITSPEDELRDEISRAADAVSPPSLEPTDQTPIETGTREVSGAIGIDAAIDADQSGTEDGDQYQAQPALEEVIGSIDAELDDIEFQSPLGYLGDHLPEPERFAKQHLVFTLAGTRYAIPSENVLEIGRVGAITSVPNVPSWMLGVTNRRGDILSIVDFREFLELEPSSRETERMLVVRTVGDEVMTGLIIDQVNGMLYLEPDQIKAPAAPFEARAAQYLKGLCEQKGELVAVLDLEMLLQSAEMRQFELV